MMPTCPDTCRAGDASSKTTDAICSGFGASLDIRRLCLHRRRDMVGSGFGFASDAAVYLLFGGALGLLVSVLVVTRVMVGEKDLRPGRRAVAHWAPVAVMGVVAALLGHPEIGLGIAFGTSVA